MSQSGSESNSIAPLENVSRFSGMVERLVNRKPALPGFGLFYGRAGLGKTTAALYAENTFRAFHVELDCTVTPRAFAEAIMVEMGLLAPREKLKDPVYRAVASIGEFMADNPSRPLIVDESDFLVRRRTIELVRAVYRHCAHAGASIVLIGEETLPGKLMPWERLDSRVLVRVKAEALSAKDVAILARLIVPGLTLDAGAVETARKRTGGSARRAVSYFYDLAEAAAAKGWTEVGAAELAGLADA